MKNLIFKPIYSAIIAAMFLSSCTKDLAKLNKNPNAYESVNANFLFTKAQLGAIGLNPNGNRFNNMQMLQQEATYSEVTAPGDKYFAEGYVQNNWAAYTGCLNQTQLVINETKKDPTLVNKLAAARICSLDYVPTCGNYIDLFCHFLSCIIVWASLSAD